MGLKLRRYGLCINAGTAVDRSNSSGRLGHRAMSVGWGHDTDYFIVPEFIS